MAGKKSVLLSWAILLPTKLDRLRSCLEPVIYAKHLDFLLLLNTSSSEDSSELVSTSKVGPARVNTVFGYIMMVWSLQKTISSPIISRMGSQSDGLPMETRDSRIEIYSLILKSHGSPKSKLKCLDLADQGRDVWGDTKHRICLHIPAGPIQSSVHSFSGVSLWLWVILGTLYWLRVEWPAEDGRLMTARQQEAALMVDLKGAAKEMNPRWGSNTK